MIRKYTPVPHSNFPLIGGEWLIAENNARESIINFSPEFCLEDPSTYRGNFHVVPGSNDGQVSVFDTSFSDESSALAQSRSGTVQLRWQEIFSGELANSYYSRPQRVVTNVAPLIDFDVVQSGWLLLRMTLATANLFDFFFEDSYLGKVYLKFAWVLLPELPEPSEKSDYLPVAALILDSSGNVEIIQQHYGPGTLWIPLKEASQSDSQDSSSSSSSSSSGLESSSSLSESGSSSSVSDSDSSNSDETAEIEVTFVYQESTDSLESDGSTFRRYGEVSLSGSFTAAAPYPDGGYTVVLTGSETYDDGEGYGEQTYPAQHTMNIFRNDELGRWDFYDADAFDWADLLDYEDTVDDISYSTPVYDFPKASPGDVYPDGTIQVDHYVVNGLNEPVPFYVLTSSLIVTFKVKK
ncbi:MAG: hypothetical protein E7052_00250 [Lentisphaerae bacterium]|nr:hypothetical protein [Lentisphaerota bacterium]